MSELSLAGRTCLVTGASSGIGNAIAAEFGRAGANVVVADIRREPKLDQERSVFEKLDDAGADATYVETDVTDDDDVEHAVDVAVSEYGGLDILVNNAGIYHQYSAHETPNDAWDDIIDINLRGVFATTRAAMPALLDSENAKVINLASIFGRVGGEKSAAYCASKGGVANLTRQMSLDYAADEVNVNALAPGIIKTAQNHEWRETDEELLEDWKRRTPWPRFGEPEDVADAALFLASDRSDFITGEIIGVDGGWTAR